MTNRSNVRFVVVLALLTAAALAAPRWAAAGDDQGRYGDLIKSRGAGGVVQPILTAFGNQTANAEIKPPRCAGTKAPMKTVATFALRALTSYTSFSHIASLLTAMGKPSKMLRTCATRARRPRHQLLSCVR